MSRSLEILLLPLEGLLERERNCVLRLDMEGLAEVLRDKAALLARLPSLDAAGIGRELLDRLQQSNRRNTRLWHAGRHAILCLWSLHCRQSAADGYNPAGRRSGGVTASQLLSGKV